MREQREGLMSREAQERLIEGARRGGRAAKHFTPESKLRQVQGARRGGQNSHRGYAGSEGLADKFR
ncbi:MAG: hypothetical protein HYX96_05260 [Chloroflexi bacterium]|nr:hypothetical protein [Chloroflexota bacterium]